MKKNKKLLSMAISVLMLTAILFTMNTSVLAAVTTYTVSTTRLADLNTAPTLNKNTISCTSVGGVGIGPNLKRLFALKSNENKNVAALYYFPNLNNGDDFKVITLDGIAGHANAMAVDDNYIYITRWREDGAVTKQITRISRNDIRNAYLSMKNNSDVTEVVFDSDDCTIFQPKVLNSDGTYSNFQYEIRSITKYKKNGQFLITYKNSEVFKSGQVAYTIAKIVDGKFVVSEAKSDIFVIKDSLFTNSTTGQAICYEPGHGLFIPRWHENHQNTVVWVNIDSSYTTDSNGYRYYSPIGHIKINKSSSIFTKYEVEAIAFDGDGYMVFSVNTACTSSTYKQKYPDGVIKVTNNKFTL